MSGLVDVRGSFEVVARTAVAAKKQAAPIIEAVAPGQEVRWRMYGRAVQPTITRDVLTTEWTVEWELVNP
jgi:hypothetical protein